MLRVTGQKDGVDAERQGCGVPWSVEAKEGDMVTGEQTKEEEEGRRKSRKGVWAGVEGEEREGGKQNGAACSS